MTAAFAELDEVLIPYFLTLTQDEVKRIIAWDKQGKEYEKKYNHAPALEAYLQMKRSAFYVHTVKDVDLLTKDKAGDTRIEMAIYLKKKAILLLSSSVINNRVVEDWKNKGLDVLKVIDTTGKSAADCGKIIAEAVRVKTEPKFFG